MSRRLSQFVTIAAIAVAAIPVWARPDSKTTMVTTVDITSTANIANTTLAPGEYKVVAEANQVKFERNGKVVAQVACTWKTLPSKAQGTEVQMDQNRITEIDFAGKTQAIQISSSGSGGN